MILKKATYVLLNPNNGKCMHIGSAGYFFFLTFSVLFVCNFLAYPVIYNNESIRFNNIVFLHYVFFNIVGNYLLGVKINSFIKRGELHIIFMLHLLYF